MMEEIELAKIKKEQVMIRELLNGEKVDKDQIADWFDLKKCDMCGEYNLEEHMFDTEGMADGGIGEVCEQCREDMR